MKYLCLGMIIFLSVSVYGMERIERYATEEIEVEYLDDPTIRKEYDNIKRLYDRYTTARNRYERNAEYRLMRDYNQARTNLVEANARLDNLIANFKAKNPRKRVYPRDVGIVDMPN